MDVVAGILRAAGRARHLHLGLHCRDCAQRYSGGTRRAMGRRHGARSAPQFRAAAHRHAAGASGHHSADDQPVSQPDQEFFAGRRGRLSGHRVDCEYHAEPDRSGDRSHRADHAGVPDHQPRHQPVHELVQCAHRAGGALMTSIADAPENPLPVGRSRSRRGRGGVIGWLRANLFSSIPSTVISLLLIFLLAKATVSFVQWGYWNAIWTVPGNQTSACRAIRGLGACWAVIPEKYRFILFGTYPFDQQWRPALATLTFVALFLVSSRRNWWRRELVLVWVAALVLIGLLMWGGIFGLAYVSQDRWGGLPVTLILATFGLAFGFPLGMRALCRAHPRRSTDQSAVHGERDVSAVHAGRRQHRQAAAGADRVCAF